MKKLLALLISLKSDFRGAFIGLLVVLLAIFSLDFVLRVLVMRDDSLRGVSVPPAAKIAPAASQSAIMKRFEAWIPPKLVVEAPPPEREISLQGIFGTGPEAKAALALSVAGGPPERIRATAGQVVDGWSVERIEPGRVVLKKGEESKELLLFRSRTE